MQWILVKKFPLTQDLGKINGFLQERCIEHRIYEEAGEQVLAVVDPRMVAPIARFLLELEMGSLVIDQDNSPPSLTATKPSLWRQFACQPVTTALIVLSALGALTVALDTHYWLVRWLSFQAIDRNELLPLGVALQRGEIWRLITPVFLHFGFMHFLFNSLWLWDLGRRLELLLGTWHFVVFFTLVSAVSNTAQYLWQPGSLFGGMSGVVYGLVGFILVSHRFKPQPLTAVPAAVLGFMLAWLLLCMSGAVDYVIGGSVANAAHLGGLLAGCLLALARVGFKLPKN